MMGSLMDHAVSIFKKRVVTDALCNMAFNTFLALVIVCDDNRVTNKKWRLSMVVGFRDGRNSRIFDVMITLHVIIYR